MVIFSLCFLLFLNAMSIGLVFPIFAPLFMQSKAPLFSPDTLLSTQNFYYSMILAVPTFCMVFGAPFWGRVSDKIGRRQVLLIGLTGIAISFALSALGITFASLILLFFSRALAGFMDGTESIAQAAMIDLSNEQTKARYMSYATFAGTIGFIIGPIVGGFLAEPSLTGFYHYQIPFMVASLLTIMNGIAIYWFLPKKNKLTHDALSENYFHLLKKGFSICWDNRIRGFSILLFILQWTLAVFFQLSTVVLAEKFHYRSGQIGIFTTFLGACFSAGILFVLHVLLKRVKYLSLLRFGISLMVLSIMSALYFYQSPLLAWVSVIPMMLGIAMMYNVLLVLISNSVLEGEQGEAMGGGTSLKALGWLFSGLFITLLYPHIITLLIIMLIILFGALLSTIYLAKHPQLVSKRAMEVAEEYAERHSSYLGEG